MINISNLNHIDEVAVEVSKVHGGGYSNNITVNQTAKAEVEKTDFGIAVATNKSVIKATQINAKVKIFF